MNRPERSRVLKQRFATIEVKSTFMAPLKYLNKNNRSVISRLNERGTISRN
jgi:hypothetical protein